MDTGEGQVKQSYLMDEVLKVNELANQLRARIWDRFIKEESPKNPKSSEAPEPNPIDYLIRKSMETHEIIKSCLELLEVQVINKLEEK